jgi:hypothetical protein
MMNLKKSKQQAAQLLSLRKPLHTHIAAADLTENLLSYPK